MIIFRYFILELSDDEHIGSIGSLLGRNAMLLFLAWVVIFVCIIRGPRSIAKVSYGYLLILLKAPAGRGAGVWDVAFYESG